MQIQTVEPGYAWVSGRGELRRVDTSLIGECQPGDYVLVFSEAARERIDAERAREIDQTLDMLEAALAGDLGHARAEPDFALPSSMDPSALAQLIHPTRGGRGPC
jgi:hydrogenase expression/formation protein HypC